MHYYVPLPPKPQCCLNQMPFDLLNIELGGKRDKKILNVCPGGGCTSLLVRRRCAPVLGSFWPENSGIGVSFYWKISVIGVYSHSELSGIGVYCYTQNSVMGVE